MEAEWLVDEAAAPTADQIAEIDRELSRAGGIVTRGRGDAAPRLAVLLRNVVCHDVQKLFGGADVRLDALVVHGRGVEDDLSSFYMPGTFRFPDVRDHQRLPIDREHGLLVFNGRPLHFLDIFVLASRDRRDSDDLASLLADRLRDAKTRNAVAALLALSAGAPAAAAVTAAVSAAAVLGDLAYRVVRAVSDKTIGMYRGSFLQFRDGFGVGRHPDHEQAFVEKDLEFWYETVVDKPAVS